MHIHEYEEYQEKKSHFDSNFPYNTYLCSIPLDFTAVPAHWHNEAEIVYIKKGIGIVTVDLISYDVTSGSIIVILPGQLHSITQKNDNSFEYENIIFNFDTLHSERADSIAPLFNSFTGRNIIITPNITNNLSYYEDIKACLDEADRICTTFPKGYQLAILSCLYKLFYILYSNATVNNEKTKNIKSIEHIKNITKYVENNYFDQITIADMAQLCDYSESHFMKFFKQNMGISFIDYINNYRLNMAANLIKSSDSDILSIACECGFNNLSYFNRLFKQKYKMTPRELRGKSS